MIDVGVDDSNDFQITNFSEGGLGLIILEMPKIGEKTVKCVKKHDQTLFWEIFLTFEGVGFNFRDVKNQKSRKKYEWWGLIGGWWFNI